MKELTINLPSGVGDAHWCIQKVLPHVDKLNLNVLVVDKGKISLRAQKFLEIVPKIGKIDYKVVSSQEYLRVAGSRFDLQWILEAPPGVYDYAMNKPLEDGIRIDKVDPQLAVEWKIDYKVNPEKIRHDDYLVFYTSGNKADQSWDNNRWISFVSQLYRRHGLDLPIVMLGADYDEKPLRAIGSVLKTRGLKVEMAINGGVDECIRYIRDAKKFIGYQSGLNIIADNYDVDQIMVYFPWLKKMKYSWCKPGHAESGKFKAFTFDERPESILAQLGKTTQWKVA